MRISLLLLLSLFLIQSCTSIQKAQKPQSSRDKLINDIQYLLADPNLSNAYLGIYIESLEDSEVLFRQNEHKLFVPASNMKLYTTAVSLAKLGPTYHFLTPLKFSGTLHDSVLNGDLVIYGKGDPTISGRFYDKDILAVFKNWADSLKQRGIIKIQGDLIADNSYFNSDILADGWNWDDEPYWYSAQPSALSYNDNCVNLKVMAGDSLGTLVHVLQNPDVSFLKVENLLFLHKIQLLQGISRLIINCFPVLFPMLS